MKAVPEDEKIPLEKKSKGTHDEKFMSYFYNFD